MKRKDFLRLSLLTMTGLESIEQLLGSEKTHAKKMPALFVGHGSPMNAIDDNLFSRKWAEIGHSMDKPKAILCISAHWYVRGTYVTAMPKPKTIHDFGGFPDELYRVQYPAKGNPELAAEIAHALQQHQAGLDMEWGLDHGTWSILNKMYPLADVPVLQLSIDYTKPPEWHYALAKELEYLRNKGVMIIGSGNMVHNLRMVAWDKINEVGYGYDWAIEINEIFKKHLTNKNDQALIHFQKLGSAAQMAIPTPDHFLPMIYIMALRDNNDQIQFFNDKAQAGSLTMTSFVYHD